MTTDKELDALVERLLAMHCDEGGAIIVHETAAAISALRQERDRLRQALQQICARLADLLDSDQFNNIEAIVLAAGVPFPPRTQHMQDCQKDWPRPGDPCTCGLDAALAPQEPTT